MGVGGSGVAPAYDFASFRKLNQQQFVFFWRHFINNTHQLNSHILKVGCKLIEIFVNSASGRICKEYNIILPSWPKIPRLSGNF